MFVCPCLVSLTTLLHFSASTLWAMVEFPKAMSSYGCTLCQFWIFHVTKSLFQTEKVNKSASCYNLYVFAPFYTIWSWISSVSWFIINYRGSSVWPGVTRFSWIWLKQSAAITQWPEALNGTKWHWRSAFSYSKEYNEWRIKIIDK